MTSAGHLQLALIAAKGVPLTGGRRTAFFVIGVVLLILGLGLMWAGFNKRIMAWNNTHLQPQQPSLGRFQSVYNTWAVRLGGLVAAVMGVVAMVVASVSR